MLTPASARRSATLLVFLTLSCSDSLEPGTLGQRYRLDRVAGDALPTVLYTNEFGTFRLAGPHLIARIDGHALRVTWGPRINGRSPLYYVEVVAPQ